ncbi:MAG: TIGR03560 family F420-dependent LLM class oxidoreductase [Chloroflexota bacterium]|nr:TIGR03560 family F420-dependent LLM class oxidoreductase [Chloroflexota bacterium]
MCATATGFALHLVDRSVALNIGIITPQGWTGEFNGWDPARAWSRTVDVARLAEALGFESVWLYDHLHTVPRPTEEITFESFTSLTAIAAATDRVRLGHVVICTAFRNPALLAKMISTMDVISGGRMEVGIGAGWKRDEWLAYGYGFPDTKERLATLADHLEVIKRMLAPGRATYAGQHASVEDAINVPKPLQEHLPIMVGGNGPKVTWRLAARHADELNVDGMRPDDVGAALPVIRSRCEEIGRDPDSLAVSAHVWWEDWAMSSQERVDRLGAYRELGVSRVITMLRETAESDEALAKFADECRAAGATLEASTALGA